MEKSTGVEIGSKWRVEVIGFNRGTQCERLLVFTTPGAVKSSLSIAVCPRQVQHADFEASYVSPRRLFFESGREELYIAIGPRIVTMPLRVCRVGKPGNGLSLPFLGGSGQWSAFINPVSLARCGWEPDFLIRIP